MYSPEAIIVLGAIKGGAKKFDKIQKIAAIDGEHLNKILEELEKDGLIQVETKKGFFGPKIEIFTTDKGVKIMEERIHELEKNWGDLKLLYQTKDKKKMQDYMDDNRSIFPMLMFFGIMDIMMFSTMLSFMGGSMGDYVPADQASDVADSGGDDGGGMDDGGFDIDIGF